MRQHIFFLLKSVGLFLLIGPAIGIFAVMAYLGGFPGLKGLAVFVVYGYFLGCIPAAITGLIMGELTLQARKRSRSLSYADYFFIGAAAGGLAVFILVLLVVNFAPNISIAYLSGIGAIAGAITSLLHRHRL